MATKPQFSLRWMFAAVTVVAFIAGEAVAFPGWLALIVGLLTTSFLPPIYVAGIVYARGYSRAFCIGALAWLLAANWIAHISLGIPVTPQGLPALQMGGLGAGYFPGLRGYIPSFRNPIYSDYGNEYRLDYCVLWGLTIVGGLAAVVVRWMTVSGKNNAPAA